MSLSHAPDRNGLSFAWRRNQHLCILHRAEAYAAAELDEHGTW